MQELQKIIEDAWEIRTELKPGIAPARIGEAVEHLLAELDAGRVRVAEKLNGQWVTHQWIKKAVLLSFRINDNKVMESGVNRYFDKVETKFSRYHQHEFEKGGFRVVPPAVARHGCHIGRNVVLMPSYVNIGAYVDDGTMVDTWATVGSCAQIGKNVHLSGGVGIGGVLEPLQANPTIIEDNCFIGARSEVVEGVIVEENSVISMGVYIGQSTKIYDRASGEVSLRPHSRRLGRGQRQPALCRRQVQPVLRRDREAGRCTDALQDQHQRTAARLIAPTSDSGGQHGHDGPLVQTDGRQEGFGPVFFLRGADHDQDQRQRRAGQPKPA